MHEIQIRDAHNVFLGWTSQSRDICTFYKQLLSMAAQQSAGQKGCKVHEDFPQKRRHFLQGPF